MDIETYNKLVEKLKFNFSLKEKYINKIHDMGIDKRNSLFEKIKNKYDSYDYINKEYKLGRFPTTKLYDIIFQYAQKYGTYIETETLFPSESFIIDDTWNIIATYGQGTIFEFKKII